MKTKILLVTLLLTGGTWLFAPAVAVAQASGREEITNKLNHIRLDVFGPYDGLPLSEMVKTLAMETKKRDPEKKGVNFLINPNPPVSAPSAPVLDPTSGLPIPAAAEQMDVNSVTIRVAMPLHDIRLIDALDAVVLTADHPIQYTIESYGVIFSAKALPAPSTLPDAKPSPPELGEFPPVIIKTVPEAGSMDVPAGECAIKITFSKEMTDQSWSWVAAWPGSEPSSQENPHFEPDHRTCVMKVMLKPGRAYGYWLNNPEFHGFQDKQHRPAVSYLLSFATGSPGDRKSDSSASPSGSGAWSPNFAPGEKPDLQKILDEAKDLMERHAYEESLQRYLWYYQHEPEYGDSYQNIVRIGSAISDWVELGRRYPKARQALLEIRDQDVHALTNGNGYAELFVDVNAINHELQDDDATYALFKIIRQKDPQLAGQGYYWIESLLVNKGEYSWCYDHIGNGQARFDLIRRSYEMENANQKRMAEQQQRTKDMLAEMNRKNGWTNLPPYSPPDTSAMMQRSSQDRFVGQVRQLIEILVGTDHVAEAEKIRDQALAVLEHFLFR